MKTFLNNHKVRGLRNNNVGNLIQTSINWQGKIPRVKNTDGHFEQFETLEFGIRAMLKDLINDINKGKNSIRKLISEYAPPTENNTNAYISSVAKTLKVTPDQQLKTIDSAFLLNLCRAIIKVELGTAHKEVLDSDIKGAIQKLGNVSTKLLTVVIDKNFFFSMKAFFQNHKKAIIGGIVGLIVMIVGYKVWKNRK